jgi:hypothetical protein
VTPLTKTIVQPNLNKMLIICRRPEAGEGERPAGQEACTAFEPQANGRYHAVTSFFLTSFFLSSSFCVQPEKS